MIVGLEPLHYVAGVLGLSDEVEVGGSAANGEDVECRPEQPDYGPQLSAPDGHNVV